MRFLPFVVFALVLPAASCAPDDRLALQVGTAFFRVELAVDPAERAVGLMHRRSLPEDAGMLFVFEEEEILSFWMRNTLIPLSIAFIDRGGRIVDIQDMRPHEETPIRSSRPALYALEVNQDAFNRNNVKVGDRVRLGTVLEFLSQRINRP